MEDEKRTEEQDFGTVLDEFEQRQGGGATADPEVGETVSGEILAIGEDAALVDLGGKAEGVVPLDGLKDESGALTVEVGDRVEGTVSATDAATGGVVVRVKPARGPQIKEELRQAHLHGIPVEGTVTGLNKGGIEVKIAGQRGFCPLSQLDLRYVEDPNRFVGQRLAFKILRLEEDPKGRRPNIVLSRRSLLEEEAQSKAAETRGRLKPGAVLMGKVTSLASYGAFVDLGGLEGLLHVSELSHRRVEHPQEVLQVGQEVEVQVIKVEKGKDGRQAERISLSRRALEGDPWQEAAERFPQGQRTRGRVARLESFGAFVELAPGLEGLVHVSELGAGRRVSHPREVVKPGQEVEVTVLGVDKQRKRISLSMAGETSEAGAEELREYAKESGGGSGSGSGFGSLGDFFRGKEDRRRR
ncbi:MAG TPA: S1 RNA-binding domain-containing protein [Thermoanaerobaculia bacterium]|nr:S1 RNA-binding domain-containing protein [Thermoanaerobaculia bacterium]